MSASLEKLTFLVVDDNVHMAHIVKTMLRGLGVGRVLEAAGPDAALTCLRENAVDVMVLDYVLGEAADGVGFLRGLRRLPESPAPFLPVIMLSAHSDKARVEGARDAGANEFCAKPVTTVELLRKIAAVIDHPRAFIRAEAYCGPDRRRRDDPEFKGPERRRDRLPQDASTGGPGKGDGIVTGR